MVPSPATSGVGRSSGSSRPNSVTFGLTQPSLVHSAWHQWHSLYGLVVLSPQQGQRWRSTIGCTPAGGSSRLLELADRSQNRPLGTVCGPTDPPQIGRA